MLIAFPNRNGSFTGALYAPLHREHSFASLRDELRLQAFMRDFFPDAIALIPNLAEQFFAREPNSMLTVRCRPWSRAGNVLLLGDAAHSVLPSYGQGANAGFEDCATLDGCLDKHPRDWRAAFLDFEQVRRPDMDVMADLCVQHFLELRKSVAEPAFLLRKALERRLSELEPGRYCSLYSLVAFTAIPYGEAVRIAQAQGALVDRLLAMEGIEACLRTQELAGLVERVARELAAHDDDQDAFDSGSEGLDPEPLISLALSFWGAKAAMAAVELRLFAHLCERPQNGSQLAIGLASQVAVRSTFFDALVALGLLERRDGVYSNSRLAQCFLDPKRPGYVGGLFELTSSRLYPVGHSCRRRYAATTAQRSQGRDDYYANLGQHQDRLAVFLRAMSGLSASAARAIARRIPWEEYRTFVDVGGAEGGLSVALAQAHPHLSGVTFELPAVRGYFEAYVASAGLGQRLSFFSGDFFKDPLPQADVIILRHVLHNWNLDQKRALIRAAYAALPEGGLLLVHESLIDDDRRRNALGLLMSLNMLLVTREGFGFTGAECEGWMHQAGFSRTRVEHLAGSESMVPRLQIAREPCSRRSVNRSSSCLKTNVWLVTSTS